MQCPSCGVPVQDKQKFCAGCGTSLKGVTNPTETVVVTPAPEVSDSVAAELSEPPVEAAGPATAELAATVAMDAVPGGSAVDDAVDHIGDAAAADTPLISDLPTREITPRDEIPDPTWALEPEPEPALVGGSLPPPPAELFDDLTTPTPAHPAPAVVQDAAATTQIATADVTGQLDPVGGGTEEVPALFDGSGDVHEFPAPREPFRIKLVFVLAFFGAVALLMSTAADMIDIRTSVPVDGIATGIRTLDAFGSNLAVAGFVGATVMALGGLLACFGFRWGAGLAGGGGLAVLGWAGLVVGLAELQVATAESITRNTTSVQFTLRVTRDLGFWLVVAVGAIGLVVFLVSLRSFGSGRRRALNPWIAALGAVAGVVLAAGPLLPVANATFANNYQSTDPLLDLPAAYFGGRLGQVGLVAFAMVFGLLIVRAYGLGLAVGGISVSVWLWISSLLDIGSFPLGIAAGNFGTSDTTPHAVTSVGMALTLFMLTVAAVMAIVSSTLQARR